MKHRLSCIAVLSLLLAGCAPSNPLDPAPSVKTGPDLAAVQYEGIQITTEVDGWPGDPSIRNHVTPMRVTIVNQGNQPIRIQYRDFKLISSKGRTFAALPLHRIEGEVDRPVAVYDVDPFEPSFAYSGFRVAPYYVDVYPSIPVYGDTFYYDPRYFSSHYTYWRDVQLPTPEMVIRSLPEGVIDPGGSVSGYLFFEKVSHDAKSVTLRADLVQANGSMAFGAIAIPFRVKG